MKNVEESLKAKLLALAKKENLDPQLIITRYLHERLLYRLSLSAYAPKFILKGGAFIYATQGIKTRPTNDIDLLGYRLPNDIDTLIPAFREICAINSADSVVFNMESVMGEPINQQDKYNGLRIHVEASFGTVKQRIQIDIGFGDIIIPEIQKIEYPILLDGMKPPILHAYSKETIVAEKFHAMIDLSVTNSRMKDFYDVYNLLKNMEFNAHILEEAIIATFDNRKTAYTENHALFTVGFAAETKRKKDWSTFLNKKINKDKQLDFEEVMSMIKVKLEPIWQKMKNR